MNSTSLIDSEIIIENSTRITTESWFIPFDILMVVCLILIIIVVILFLLIIIFDKACHTISMMLVANAFLAQLLLASDILGMIVFMLKNDLKQIQYEDSLCAFRGYLGFVFCGSANYSYLLLAFYRYITVVYPAALFWQSMRTQILLIGFTWIFSFICSIAFLFTHEIIYNVDNQICQLPLRLSFSLIFVSNCIYNIPMSFVIFIYFKLVRYVKEMGKNITSAFTLIRARRELKMVRRIVILVISLTIISVPYTIFIFLSFFTLQPKYHFRIAYIFINVLLIFVIIAFYQFTDPLKMSLMKRIKRRTNVVVARVT